MKRLPTTVIVALLALALTATAVFAARAPQQVRPQAEETPIVIGDATPTPGLDDGAAPTAGEDETETPDADETGDSEDTPGAHPSNHGWTVSQAAHQTTPPGCRNHGQYVSIVARGEYDPFATPAPGATPAEPCPSVTPKPDKTKNPNADKTPKAGNDKPHGASASHRHNPK